MLKIIDITKDYVLGDQTVQALKGVSLEFRKNEFVSILGPSGCGKTTLLNIIGGLDQYTTGDLTFEGISTKNYKDKDWDNYRNKKIGFVFQNYNLIPHLSVLGNVELALTLSGVSAIERKQRAKKALDSVGLRDQITKRPNQLSGGQMQRVAIARALVNDPEIILADEPTGALDTKTSIQVMEIIKEISKERLVIMVTHNRDLAETYSSRIIDILDGQITDDSNPFHNGSNLKSHENKVKESKTSMSFFTAFSLSARNLITKKTRTLITAFAGSIGIIGIALVLAISNGFNNYIDKMQADTLANYPIQILENTIDFTSRPDHSNQGTQFPSDSNVYVQPSVLDSLLIQNTITEDYITYLKNNIDPNDYYDITYSTGMKMNIFYQQTGVDYYTNVPTSTGGGMFGGNTIWQQLLNLDFVKTQYDVIDGRLPENKNEIVVIVDDYNQIPEETLIALGLKTSGDDTTQYSFDQILNLNYKVLTNDELYTYSNGIYTVNSPLNIDFSQALNLKVVGILRVNPQTEGGALSTGIGYTKDLMTELQNANMDSSIIQWMDDNNTLNPLTGLPFSSTGQATPAEVQTAYLRQLGGISVPNQINIYAKDFDSKTAIKTVLDNYNIGKADDKKIQYTDLTDVVANTLSSVVNTISYVLIAFTAISLLVSSIMIGIITYVSVVERTKEIGILRSIGARKKDVSRVFNAETLIIGFVSGVFGIVVTFLLTLPINMILQNLLDIENIANLTLSNAVILIVISMILTFISGLIPSRIAAKKDPVIALRTE